MPPQTTKPDLTSWKEIADYIGVNVRTAQKWEKTRGLPVRRFAGQKGRVLAVPEELDRWKTTAGDGPRWWHDARLLRWYAAATTVALAALLAWIAIDRWVRGRPGAPGLFRADYRTLVVMDSAGRELWEHTFDDPFATDAYSGSTGALRSVFADVDGDARTELLFAYYSTKSDTQGVPLYCFSDAGRVKWRFTPGRAIADGGRTYGSPYIVTAIAVVDLGGSRGRVIAAANRHAVYYPSQFVLLDGRGKILGEYWHSGHLDNMAFMDLDGDGTKEILLSGVNNGYRAAALVALDARDFTGASDQRGSLYQLRGLPLHKERALVLFPRTCMNRKLGLYNMAHEIFTGDGQIRVHVRENEPEDFVIYTLDAHLDCTYAEATDGFRNTHLRLEAQRALDHALTETEVAGWRQAVARR